MPPSRKGLPTVSFVSSAPCQSTYLLQHCSYECSVLAENTVGVFGDGLIGKCLCVMPILTVEPMACCLLPFPVLEVTALVCGVSCVLRCAV